MVGSDSLSQHDLLQAMLMKDEQQPREEPLVAQNLNEQLVHMGLSTWSISVLRRIRDLTGRYSAPRVLEVGGSIGHRAAWLLDLFERQGSPACYHIVEEGAKFAVILKRLFDRYKAQSWCKIIVGQFQTLISEERAVEALPLQTEENQRRFLPEYDVIIIDQPLPVLSETIQSTLPLLAKNGILLTVEPSAPTDEIDVQNPQSMMLVNGFNDWIQCIKSTHDTHELAFVPLFGGTLVAWMA